MMLTPDNTIAHNRVKDVIAAQLAACTSLTADGSRRAAERLITEFSAKGFTITGPKVADDA